MRTMLGMICVYVTISCFLAGCGKSDKPEMAEAGGLVTYNDEPLDSASVVFIPTSGPAAYGTTDAQGKFTWMTRGESGAMVGEGQVVITANVMLDEPKEEEDLTEADLRIMGQSRIPLKYAKAETSGLSATIGPNKEENQFTFSLTD
jgi:hypothetical protein